MPLMSALLHRLESQQLLESFWLLEMPIAVVLAWMEHVAALLNEGASLTRVENTTRTLLVLDLMIVDLTVLNNLT